MSGLVDVLGPQADQRKIHGVVTAVVTNNQDKEKLGRVKVRFPWLSQDDESFWARIAVPMAAQGAGTYFLPDVDDEVLVAFEHGDFRFPYVVGALWRSGAGPPQSNDDGNNAVREIRTPAGLSVAFDDKGKTIVVTDAGGRATITVSDGKVTVDAPDGIELKSDSGTLKLAGMSVEIKASASLKLEASANVDVKGALINLG